MLGNVKEIVGWCWFFKLFLRLIQHQRRCWGEMFRNELIKRYVPSLLKTIKTINYILDDLEFLMFIIKNGSLTDL